MVNLHAQDCLFLNIWVPADVLFGDSDSLSPVLVWIYGGGPAVREAILAVKSRKPFVKG